MENKSTENSQQKQLTEKEIIAQNIAFFRKKLDMSQTELGKTLNYSNKNISKWEKAETTPDIFTLKKLSNIFGITIDTLVSPISTENKEAIQTKKAVPLKWKVYMLTMVDTIIFLLSCIAFSIVSYYSIPNFSSWYVFLIALPLIALSIFIFLCCIQKRVEIISLSMFCWLIILAIYIILRKSPHIAYIFVIGLGVQVFIIALGKLINSGKIIKINKLLIKRAKK